MQISELVIETKCSECKKPLEPIYSNSGFQAPDPEYNEIVGYKPCECRYYQIDTDDWKEFCDKTGV